MQDAEDDQAVVEAIMKKVRISKLDLENPSGPKFTAGCPRCAPIEYDPETRSKAAHNEECRRRYYRWFKETNHRKWLRARQDVLGQLLDEPAVNPPDVPAPPTPQGSGYRERPLYPDGEDVEDDPGFDAGLQEDEPVPKARRVMEPGSPACVFSYSSFWAYSSPCH